MVCGNAGFRVRRHSTEAGLHGEERIHFASRLWGFTRAGPSRFALEPPAGAHRPGVSCKIVRSFVLFATMSVSEFPLKVPRPPREGRALQKGQQTKAAIVDAALGLATQIGLEGLSIGALAEV